MSERALIDVVMVTNGKRMELLKQSVDSLLNNSKDIDSFQLTVVHDGALGNRTGDINIFVDEYVGASRCRNIGASSVPKYRRGQYVMFVDDDVYMCPGWDERLLEAMSHLHPIVSGHAHPYNHTVLESYPRVYRTTVLSTVHMFMAWETWDEIGWFTEPGGPGGSEDVDWCKRADNLGFNLYVTKPHCVIHAGLTNSKGEKIVGYEQMVKQNTELIKHYRIPVQQQ